MSYKRTDKAPGRPLKDPKAEAERQRKWHEKQKAKTARRVERKAVPPERVIEHPPEPQPKAAKKLKPKRRADNRDKRARVGFGAHAKALAKPHVPLAILGHRQRNEEGTRVRRRSLRGPAVT